VCHREAAAVQKIWVSPYYSQRAVFASIRALFHFIFVVGVGKFATSATKKVFQLQNTQLSMLMQISL